MALESSPDQTNRKVKHAMLLSGHRNSSSATSLSQSLNDSTGESSSPIECNSIRSGTRRHGSLDISMPRVHSVGRAVDVLNAKVLKPDLLNLHLHYESQTDICPSDSSDQNHNTDASNDIVQDDNIPNGTIHGKRLSDAGQQSKLNIPGNSVVVSDSGPVCSAEPFPIPTVENLRPYPPGLITIVKEGPAHESPSSILLDSIERELEDLEPLQSRKNSIAMAAADKIGMKGLEQNGSEISGCHCRIALQERLHATVKGCLQLQHQVDLADSKCARWEREAGEAAENASLLRARVSELEIELAARNASLHGLKAKVAQQFMENDDINEKRRQFERDCKAQLTQMDSLKKSELWYREQLHLTQVERTTLQKQLMKAQEEGVRQEHEIEKMRTDLKRVQDQLEEQEEKSLKEKQNFTMRLEKALAFSARPFSAEDSSKSKQEADPHTVSELKQRVLDLELSLESNNKILGRSGEEIDRLLARSLQLQRELSETKIKLQEEQDRYLSAAKDREKTDAELKERTAALTQLSQEHAKLAVKLECQAREREEQEEALSSLTRSLNTVSSRFNAMRTEAQQQRAEVEALRGDVRAARAERDALQARVEEAARREQAAAVSARLQAGEREVVRGAREAQLEHEVLGLREATERARGVQQRVDQLQTERDQLSGLNEQMRAQIERLSQLLQQNTGSRVRDQPQPEQPDQLQAENNQLQVEKSQLQMEKSQLQGELEKSTMVKEQLQTENHQLQAQVQRSAARLEELNHTIQNLEAEMAAIRERHQQQGEDEDEDDAEAEALEAEMTHLRTANAQLQRERLELTARVEELSQWLDTMTQGLGLGARGQAMERLARMTTSPMHVDVVDGGDGQGDGQTDVEEVLRSLREANSELSQYAAALQRRLDDVDSGTSPKTTPRPRPDLLEGEVPDAPAQPQVDEAEARGLLALLQVCLYRLGGVTDVLQDGDDDVLIVGDVGRLAAAIRRSVNKLAVRLEGQGTLGALADGDRESRLRALEILEEEHRDLRDREGRRDALVRTLMARLKDQVLARKAAEQKLAVLGALGLGAAGSPGAHSCHSCLPNGTGAAPTPAAAAGDGLAGGENEAAAAAPAPAQGEADVLEVVRLEQELAQCQANIAELHKQLFSERRDVSQLRKEVASLRMGLDTANDMLDSNKVALGRSEAYGQVLKVSKDQLQDRFEKEQRDHEDCRARLERLQEQLQEARAKDPLIESQLKSLGCHLHQRTAELRALQDKLALRDGECAELRAQLERQRAAARAEYDGLCAELQQARRQFADAVNKMSSSVPDPVPCDEEGLSALIQESNRLSPAVLDDLKALLHNLKAELSSVEKEVGFPCERAGPVVQHV